MRGCQTQSGSGKSPVVPGIQLSISRPCSSTPSGVGTIQAPRARAQASRACTVGVQGPALRRTVSPTRITVFT
ncbi:hypothetical protein [Cellulomonas denverensis]|uniref:hypothetical protein n=1 Tax=Cellulomonas denverensis TaxID=264297 RepID=UPI0035EA2234